MERWTRTPEGTWNVLRTFEETHAISAMANSTSRPSSTPDVRQKDRSQEWFHSVKSFCFVVFRPQSLLDILESRVMKRMSINHCAEVDAYNYEEESLAQVIPVISAISPSPVLNPPSDSQCGSDFFMHTPNKFSLLKWKIYFAVQNCLWYIISIIQPILKENNHDWKTQY